MGDDFIGGKKRSSSMAACAEWTVGELQHMEERLT